LNHLFSVRGTPTDRDNWELRIALEAADQLGECPHWDSRSGQLIRVDISAGLVHCWHPDTQSQSTLEVGAPVSFAVPRDLGGFVIGRQHSVCLLERHHDEAELAAIADHSPDIRFNDAKCDRVGRLWAGTMSTTRTPGTAALYRLDGDGELQTVVNETTISNGLGWSPDSERMYFIDSTTQRIDAFDFDLAAGTISDRRTFAQVDRADGLPDGLAVDSEGGVWVCLFAGGALRRYGDDGALTAEVALPTSNPTSPVFGGRDLETVYLTTAKHRLTRQQLEAEPYAGAVFAFEPGVRGLAGNRFAG
jgi:sugar lactone lactonase YvrE